MMAGTLVTAPARWCMAVVFGLVLALGCSQPATAQTAGTKPIVVKAAAPEFTITLEANPTTGYGWFLDTLDSGLIEAVGRAFAAPAAGALGASGRETWTFRARAGAFAVPRVTTVIFRSLRPWETEAGREARFTVLLVPGS